MFNLFKKGVTAKEYGHQTWLYCCNSADQFCLHSRPKLQAAGYVKNPTADLIFMQETMRLHLWIISRALGPENSNALDALHNHAHGLNFINSKSLCDLYAIYDKAASIEIELQDAGLQQPVVAMTALKHLVNNDAQGEIDIAKEIQFHIDIIINEVREVRSQFKIR